MNALIIELSTPAAKSFAISKLVKPKSNNFFNFNSSKGDKASYNTSPDSGSKIVEALCLSINNSNGYSTRSKPPSTNAFDFLAVNLLPAAITTLPFSSLISYSILPVKSSGLNLVKNLLSWILILTIG